MRVLGIHFGRRNGNDEVLLKEALLGAQEAGAEVEFMRYNDYLVLPCNSCRACNKILARGGGYKCVRDDNFAEFEDKFMEADGVIMCAPIYEWGPSGAYRNLADRFGSSHDVVFKRRDGYEGHPELLDQRWFKHRVAGLISVGGTTNPNYATVGLSMMPMVTHSLQVDVVDQLMVLDSTMPGQVLKHEDKIERVHKLGYNVAISCGVPRSKLEWLGDTGAEDDCCPHCHNNLFVLNKDGDDYVSCCLCAIDGKISLDEEGAIQFHHDPLAVERYRNSDAEMLSHGGEIVHQQKDWMENQEKYLATIDRYKNYNVKQIKPEKKRA